MPLKPATPEVRSKVNGPSLRLEQLVALCELHERREGYLPDQLLGLHKNDASHAMHPHRVPRFLPCKEDTFRGTSSWIARVEEASRPVEAEPYLQALRVKPSAPHLEMLDLRSSTR
mmetsp:Transcript_61036/g.108530  ORF Transcript_61036/g.108530 Transcript_61036/m.108530 type:complete len:116 (-) Transcript_61036:11-358(-)